MTEYLHYSAEYYLIPTLTVVILCRNLTLEVLGVPCFMLVKRLASNVSSVALSFSLPIKTSELRLVMSLGCLIYLGLQGPAVIGYSPHVIQI